jgi:hypothetical protein
LESKAGCGGESEKIRKYTGNVGWYAQFARLEVKNGVRLSLRMNIISRHIGPGLACRVLV